MSIKKLPTSERPYEKMQMYGAESLSNSELLAVIIKTGTNQKTSVELAQEILTIKKEENSLQFLQDISIEEFMQIKGIGVVKAIQLLLFVISVRIRKDIIKWSKRGIPALLKTKGLWLIIPFLVLSK